MKLVLIVLAVLLLASPALPLLGVALLANPAATHASCTDNGLAVGTVPERLEATAADGALVSLETTQLGHAATIIAVGARTRGVTRQAVLAALTAALTESGLRMLANTTSWPESGESLNDGDGGDHDSLGLFQMRPTAGWGTVAQLMDPQYQARAFYGGPSGPNHADPPGLLDISGWRTLDPAVAAQRVEVSAHPDRYRNWLPVAQAVLGTLTTPADDDDAGAAPESSQVTFPLPSGTWVRTSRFGWRTHPITGTQNLHRGTDYAAPAGTPILATADGTVTFAGPMTGFGNAVIIHHTVQGRQVASLYGHMADGHLHVKTGDQVTAGQHIADVGSAGNSTGPHLHFEIHPQNDRNQATDPDAWLGDHGATSQNGPSVSTSGCYQEDN